MNSIALNDDLSLCAFCNSKSFGTASIEPFGILFECSTAYIVNNAKTGDFGARMVDVMPSSSLLFLAGSGDDGSFSPRKLRIVNTKRLKIICELGFSSTVEKVEVGGRSLIICSDGEIYIYDLASMKLETTLSEPGKQLRLIAGATSGNLIAFTENVAPSRVKVYDVNAKTVVKEIDAHRTGVKIAKLSSDGSLLATASERVTCTTDGQLKEEFRRGTTPTTITSLNFSSDSQYIGVASISDTGHIFKLDNKAQDASKLSIIVSGSRDFAHIKAKGKYKIMAVVPKVSENQVYVFRDDGMLEIYSLDIQNGNECKLLKSYNLFGATIEGRNHIEPNTGAVTE